MIVNDLIPANEKLKTLFILESPLTDEIRCGYPCAGFTGKEMAKRIIAANSQVSFGEHLFNKASGHEQYGLMNTFLFPLELPEKLDSIQTKYCKLKQLGNMKGWPREEIYKSHYNVLPHIEITDQEIEYTVRLKKYLLNSEQQVTLVVCGYIAQSVFLTITKKEKEFPRYNRLENNWTVFGGKTVNVLFVNHPADSAGWVFRLTSL
ncbi:MAG: hypothetical protein JNM51_00070 [Bacteroidia bacterium]|nr:hypothetical protein [Bacteroidia bacterium]